MWERAILPEIEVPAIGILWEPLLTDTGEESIVVILPLTPTYDLAVPLGGDEIVTEDGTRVLWVLLHIEGLRSEEHTSELQSRGHLVCRLLLEKKKAYTQIII